MHQEMPGNYMLKFEEDDSGKLRITIDFFTEQDELMFILKANTSNSGNDKYSVSHKKIFNITTGNPSNYIGSNTIFNTGTDGFGIITNDCGTTN
jgi:hypothetical protein